MKLKDFGNKKVLIVEDEKYLGKSIEEILQSTGFETQVAEDTERGMEKIQEIEPDLIIIDLALPPTYKAKEGVAFVKKCLELENDSKILVMTDQGKMNEAIECIKSGAEDFLIKPINPDVLNIVVERAVYKQSLERRVKGYELEYGKERQISKTVGRSDAMRKVFRGIRYAASMNENVFILGETGTGKGMIARSIHEVSDRNPFPFVRVDCSALSSTLIEKELFGHEKGSFSSAADVEVGKFEYAEKGTIFLDGVAELSPDLQDKLLPVVENKVIQRVGGKEDIKINARIIASSNKNIDKALADGSFLKDLFYRLNIIPIYIPPLRERKEDIFPLVSCYTEKYAKKFKKHPISISPEALEKIESYSWPGNIRELSNIIASVIRSTDDKVLTADNFPDSLFIVPRFDKNND